MINLLGEYDCKMDAKGRLMLPAGLKKQLADVLSAGFVINRNLHQPCLVVYPQAEWQRLSSKLKKLNRLVKKNDVIVRKVMGGATPVELDGSGRILVPKSLSDHANLNTEVKVIGSNNTIEIWSKSAYESFMNDQEIDLEALAEDVFGSLNDNDDE
ncbi:MAG: division/cell wall cluster transcriptional repressor MraZ [Cryomorphaceae bacterium]|nr:MAG: division/cell wall cluster transcriptional repressor MraZ [Cryomorphaceae bacterium]